jgi:hypothetical protein
MGNKFSNIKERILYLLEIKGIIKEKFFIEIGMTYGNFTGKAKKTPLNSTAIGNIFSKIPDVNLEWLLTGNGETLKKIEVSEQKNEIGNEIFFRLLSEKDKRIEELSKEIGGLKVKLESIEKNRLLPILSGVTIPEDTTVEKYNVNKNEVSVNEENNLKI